MQEWLIEPELYLVFLPGINNWFNPTDRRKLMLTNQKCKEAREVIDAVKMLVASGSTDSAEYLAKLKVVEDFIETVEKALPTSDVHEAAKRGFDTLYTDISRSK